MNIGNLVTSSIYPDKKQGKIVDIQIVDGTKYYDIYFSHTREVLTLAEKDVNEVTGPIIRLKNRNYDHPLLFQLRILAEKLESLIYQDKIIAANNFNIIPLPHQVLTVNQVLEQFKHRCLIADEVGLGKTIEAALIFEEMKMRKMVDRILIVTPSNLTMQWKDELETKFNEEFLLIDGSSFKSLKQVHGEHNVWDQYNQVITSIDYVKPRLVGDHLSDKMNMSREWHNAYVTQDCVDSPWDMVIFDEAHNLSKSSDGSETLRYKFAKPISERSPYLLLLSATPHQGDSRRFRHLLRLIDEYKFFAEESLSMDNVKSVTVKNHKRAVTDFEGNLIFKKRIVSIAKIPREKKDIETKLYDEVTEYVSEYYKIAEREGNFPFMFLLILYQRMVSSSSKAIYKSMKKRFELLQHDIKSASSLKKMDISDLRDADAQQVYDEILKFQMGGSARHGNYHIQPHMKEEIRILKECVSLAKESSSGRKDFKLRMLLKIIDDVINREGDPKTKFIVFTEFIETQKYIGETLENLGYKVAYFNGRMSLDDKIDAKSRFKDDHQFLVSTDSGGEGINLQFCHVMINYDLPWNPMRIEQRIGRVDRIGQDKDVLIYNFMLEGTVEERVREVLEGKLDRIADEFGDDKRTDVLSLLQDEYNFDKIYMEAVRLGEINQKELERTGTEIYLKAKAILEKQDLMVPFSADDELEKIKNHMVENEEKMVRRLVQTYADYEGAELKEYSRNKNVYYIDNPLKGIKLRKMVFDPELAIDSEEYQYINLNHPLVNSVVKDIIEDDALAFDLEITGFNENVRGFLFYYRLELTNNEGFNRRHIIPVFINQNGTYNHNVTLWFESNYEFNFRIDVADDMLVDIEILESEAKGVLELRIKDYMTETKLELYEKIEIEQQKSEKYFNDRQAATLKIPIDNIREKRLRDIEDQRLQEKMDLQKKKNLVPKTTLFAIAEVTLMP